MKRILSLALGAFLCVSVSAQKTQNQISDLAKFKEAKDLFERKQYTAAQDLFQEFHNNCATPYSEICAQAVYYAAVCAMELYHPDAENLVADFVTENPTSPLVNQAKFDLARHYFQRKKYRDAKNWLKQVDPSRLSLDAQQEYAFKLGYGYFLDDDYRSALIQFNKVTDRNSEFKAPALYYTGHVHYLEKNYQSALESFTEIEADPAFGPIVPYYVSQIYFVQERYEELLVIAEKLLDRASASRAAEVAKLIGESHYKLESFEEAIPYLEMYRVGGGRMSIEDYYQLGFAYYQANMHDKAVTAFNKITSKKDSLAQNAYYHLADSYIKLDDKQEAKNAFYAASKLDFDSRITEEAAFNYAKLTYELGDPYSDPIKAIQSFVKEYPNSKRKEEAYEFLVNYFLSTRNYSKALKSLEEIGVKSYQMEVAYQKIAYSRGVQLYNNGDWKGAIKYFDKSNQYKHDNQVLNLAKFWTAEAFYKLGKLENAENFMTAFQQGLGATRLDVYPTSFYTKAYAQFKQEKYSTAVRTFNRFLNTDGAKKYKLDARVRIADAYFMNGEYLLAINAYKAAVSDDSRENDYSLFQQGICLGLLDRYEEQTATFSSLLEQFERSAYRDDAHYEKGVAHMALNEYSEAIASFDQLLEELPQTAYRSRVLLNIGLLYYNLGENEKSIDNFKLVVNEFPNTAAAKEAIRNVRNVYVDVDRVSEYAEWVSGLAFADVSKGSLDSASYEAAEKVFLSNDCEKGITAFSNYLKTYENGYFALQANFYRAQCYLKQEDYDKALVDFKYVIDASRSEFTEPALLRAAQIYMFRKNYGQALNQYAKLEKVAEYPANLFEAQLGSMRAYYQTTSYEDAIKYARLVLESPKASARVLQEAHLVIAKAAYKLRDYPLATTEFKISEGISENAQKAESSYYLAQLYFIDGKTDIAKKKVFDLIENQADYPYWVSKSLLVLARCYLKEQDFFNAEYTLGRLIEIVADAEVKAEAAELLEVVKEEKEKADAGSRDTLNVEMD